MRRRFIPILPVLFAVAGFLGVAGCGGMVDLVKDGPVFAEVGKTLRFGYPKVFDVSVTLKSFDASEPVADRRLAVATLEIENHGDAAFRMFSLQSWTLRGGDARAGHYTWVLPPSIRTAATSLTTGSLAPGERLRGRLYFELPDDAGKPQRLELEDGQEMRAAWFVY